MIAVRSPLLTNGPPRVKLDEVDRGGQQDHQPRHGGEQAPPLPASGGEEKARDHGEDAEQHRQPPVLVGIGSPHGELYEPVGPHRRPPHPRRDDHGDAGADGQRAG
ncbi:hypothetical protein [Frankia sp. ArI3]|uniref:hypothetical protein n=1 Tax=Frankia sp. ArI3 TaxID=1858 RepID=UPI001C6FC948|nr:hypothetical protein [Frankia sp. ArI3]